MWENASKNNVIVSEIISKLRDINTVPTDFRSNLRRLGNFLAFEAAKHLDSKTSIVQTPLGEAKYDKIVDNIVIISILRAALPMSDG
ncbi:MAG: uracil phosphoribosyltransferase, partial [Candidatus Heimdallarchaeota archaeon]|nr:uracil phosphoribosyltransferase [Candidatus Heimdallarchaeota archaeon]